MFAFTWGKFNFCCCRVVLFHLILSRIRSCLVSISPFMVFLVKVIHESITPTSHLSTSLLGGNNFYGEIWHLHSLFVCGCFYCWQDSTNRSLLLHKLDTPFPIPSLIEIFWLNVFKLRASRGPAQAIGSCRTGPPTGWKIPKTFDEIWRMMGWEMV